MLRLKAHDYRRNDSNYSDSPKSHRSSRRLHSRAGVINSAGRWMNLQTVLANPLPFGWRCGLRGEFKRGYLTVQV